MGMRLLGKVDRLMIARTAPKWEDPSRRNLILQHKNLKRIPSTVLGGSNVTFRRSLGPPIWGCYCDQSVINLKMVVVRAATQHAATSHRRPSDGHSNPHSHSHSNLHGMHQAPRTLSRESPTNQSQSPDDAGTWRLPPQEERLLEGNLPKKMRESPMLPPPVLLFRRGPR